MIGTASWMEILAAAFNLGGLIAVARLYWLTRRNLRSAIRIAERENRDAELETLAADRHFRCELVTAVYHMASLFLGVWVMTLPDGGTWYGWSAMTTRLILGAVFLVNSLRDLSQSDKLDNAIRRGARKSS